MDILQLLQGLAERVSSSASVRNVYGEPVTAGDRTLIPVAKVQYGFGGGGGRNKDPECDGGGGGGGVSVHASGVVEIAPSGTRFISFDDKRRMGAALALGFALGIAVAGLLRDRGAQE
jgi:uncharacterized spore protein YtfJ